MSNVSMDYYRTFYYVVKCGNFSKAAKELNTTQPNVTRIIHALEEKWECRLLVRSRTGIRLTSEGRCIYPFIEAACLKIEEGEENLRTKMEEMEPDESGRSVAIL